MATINGTNNNDELYGTVDADTINGRGGHDILQGRGGADTLNGGDGYDTARYTHSSVGVAVNLATGRGFGGSAEGDVLTSIEGLIGSYYNDYLVGDAQYNEFYGHNGADILDGGEGGDLLYGDDKDDTLKGGGGDDILDGGHDRDTLKGGGGANSLRGGQGIDTADYSASSLAVYVDLAQNFGHLGDANGDTFDSVENITGSAYNDLLVGNSEWNTINGGDGLDEIAGGAGNDTLDGGRGNDIMSGGTGQDVFYADSAGDFVVELAGEGFDNVYASVSYTLAPDVAVERLRAVDYFAMTAIDLTGNNLANEILGNLGNNVLNGGGGADLLEGYRGDDTYFVDNADDVIHEYDGNGTDTVNASGSYTLAAEVSAETLQTTDAAGTSSIKLVGNEFANIVIGNSGNNILSGGGGGDTIRGLGGNDTYFVDNANDVVVEAAGQGTDNVNTSVSYVLKAGVAVETLRTTNAAGTTAINLVGNEFTNILIGNAGNNALNGGGGSDTMRGLAGNDSYAVDSAADRIVEAIGQGTDSVSASVSYTLAAGVSVETLRTANPAGTTAINLTGNALNNIVTGNAGANILNGGGGVDRLTGGAGNDVFMFNTTLAATNVDIITDFSVVNDTMRLENAVFSGLAAGVLNADAFHVGTTAADAEDRIIYNDATGALYFDVNGNAAGGMVQFAKLTAGLALTNLDFAII